MPNWTVIVIVGIVLLYYYMSSRVTTTQTVFATTPNTWDQWQMNQMSQAVADLSQQVYRENHPLNASIVQK